MLIVPAIVIMQMESTDSIPEPCNGIKGIQPAKQHVAGIQAETENGCSGESVQFIYQLTGFDRVTAAAAESFAFMGGEHVFYADRNPALFRFRQ